MRGQSRQNRGLAWLLILAGLILLLAGIVSLLPAANATAPDNFGEEAPPVRSTVTPLPRAGQMTPEPMLLPAESAAHSAGSSQTGVGTLRSDRAGGNPTRLIIPAINLDAPVAVSGWHSVNGVGQWDVPDHFAAGWLKTTAPLGRPGNTVLTGHHNIAGEVFRYLVNLKRGDEIEVDASGRPHFYKVTMRKIVPEAGQPEAVRMENAQWMLPTDDERLTLITCWPYTNNTHRLIIVAKPFDPERDNGRGSIQ